MKAVQRSFADLVGDRDHGRAATLTTEGGNAVSYSDPFSDLRTLSKAVNDVWASQIASIFLLGKASPEVEQLIHPLIKKRHGATVNTTLEAMRIAEAHNVFTSADILNRAFDLFEHLKNLPFDQHTLKGAHIPQIHSKKYETMATYFHPEGETKTRFSKNTQVHNYT